MAWVPVRILTFRSHGVNIRGPLTREHTDSVSVLADWEEFGAMKALTWQGRRSVSVEVVSDPIIQEPTDATVKITSTAICGSDLHLYEVLGPYLSKGDVIGHEPMGIVAEVGSAVTSLRVGDRVVVTLNIACGTCLMCRMDLQSQCEPSQVRERGSGARLFGYSELYGSVPGGQAEDLRVPHADYVPIEVGGELPDVRCLYLSDIVPTAWQGVKYANVPDGGTLTVLGLGPVGQSAARTGIHLGYRVIGVDPVRERRAMAPRHGVEALDHSKDVGDELRQMPGGRGPDSVVDAVGVKSHGSPVGAFAQKGSGSCPMPWRRNHREGRGRPAQCLARGHRSGPTWRHGVSRWCLRGMASPMPMRTMFDKQIQSRMGRCNVKRWVDELLPLVEDPADPLGVTDLVSHELPLENAPAAYDMFQKKRDGCIKVVLKP